MSESFHRETLAPETLHATRPFFWSVRRELWEHRSLYIGPLAVASVALLAFFISATMGTVVKPLRLDPNAPQGPYDIVAALMMFTTILVSAFYCAEALQGERRDRSILYWKSLPVSDTTTVLAKASIPLIILPFLVIAITFAVHFIMLLVSSALVLATGGSVAAMWTKLSFFHMSMLVSYHILGNHAIWPFPVYCYLLMVSAWARRAPWLWAVLPIVAISGVEALLFHTSHFAMLVGSRLIGDAPTAVHSPDMFPTSPMTHVTPGIFLFSPGLWVGLAVAAAFLAVAIRLRRYQGPI